MPKTSLFPRKTKGLFSLYPTGYNTGMTGNDTNAKETTMNATASKYEVRNLGSEVWRHATEQEISVALKSSRRQEWSGGIITGNWTTSLGMGCDVREFRCTVSR